MKMVPLYFMNFRTYNRADIVLSIIIYHYVALLKIKTYLLKYIFFIYRVYENKKV